MQSYWLIFAALLSLGSADSENEIFFQDKPLKKLFTIVCSNMANQEQSDACTGCFMKLSVQMQDADFNGSFKDCASHYLKSTIYHSCGVALQQTISNASSMCEFQTCVRNVRTRHVIKVCANKAKEESDDAVDVFTKTASCVLCKTHCLDRKFRVQYESPSQRRPVLVLDEEETPIPYVISYYNMNDNMVCANNNYPPADESNPLPFCDCTMSESDI